MAVGLAALLCGCPIISEDLANQKTMLPVEDTATNEGDVDGDGYTTEQGDCDDNDPNISPTVTDDLGDGVDQNCDGVDGVDRDGDGWASQQSGGLDCNDEEPATHPEAPDPGSDEIDQNCDGVDGTDGDADGYASKESGGLDCDDTDPTVGDCSICNSRSTPSYALSFDGINDRVEIGTAPTLVGLGSAVTVETWIRVVDDNDSYCGILIEATGSTPFMLYFHGYQDWEYVRVRFSTDDDAVAVETEEGTVLPDTWQHLLATYDGSAVRVYLDGVLTALLRQRDMPWLRVERRSMDALPAHMQ